MTRFYTILDTFLERYISALEWALVIGAALIPAVALIAGVR